MRRLSRLELQATHTKGLQSDCLTFQKNAQVSKGLRVQSAIVFGKNHIRDFRCRRTRAEQDTPGQESAESSGDWVGPTSSNLRLQGYTPSAEDFRELFLKLLVVRQHFGGGEQGMIVPHKALPFSTLHQHGDTFA